MCCQVATLGKLFTPMGLCYQLGIGDSWAINRHITLAHICGLAERCLADGYGNGDQCRHMGPHGLGKTTFFTLRWHIMSHIYIYFLATLTAHLVRILLRPSHCWYQKRSIIIIAYPWLHYGLVLTLQHAATFLR